MTQQQESRWSLNSTGNRVFFAVVIGLFVGVLASLIGLHGATRVLVFALVAGIAYLAMGMLRR